MKLHKVESGPMATKLAVPSAEHVEAYKAALCTAPPPDVDAEFDAWRDHQEVLRIAYVEECQRRGLLP